MSISTATRPPGRRRQIPESERARSGNVMLTGAQWVALAGEAEERGTSVSALVRQAVDRLFDTGDAGGEEG